MRFKYDIRDILEGVTGYRGTEFPGLMIPRQADDSASETRYALSTTAPEQQQYLRSGTPLYARDTMGRWYFMPVYLSSRYKSIEFPYAIVSVKGRKTIVETTLAGSSRGAVNELISLAGYTISLSGLIVSGDGTYPEEQITQLRELVMLNEPLEIVCALTDLLLDPADRVIVLSYDYPSTPGLENGQAVKLEMKTDSPFELILE